MCDNIRIYALNLLRYDTCAIYVNMHICALAPLFFLRDDKLWFSSEVEAKIKADKVTNITNPGSKDIPSNLGPYRNDGYSIIIRRSQLRL